MKRALALALVALLGLAHAPHAAAGSHAPLYPAELTALLPRWIDEAEALVAPGAQERPWWPEAERFLTMAKDASSGGRLRVAMFHLETFTELTLTGQLMDDANASRTSDAERKAYIQQRVGAMRHDSEEDWARFRATLHGYDAQLRSLQTIEKALYAADIAATGRLLVDTYDGYAQEFPRQAGVPKGYVMGLVRAAHTSGLNVGWAQDMLAESVKQEGLPPRVLEEPWANITSAAVQVPEGDVPSYMRPLADLADEARANNETLLSIVLSLAEQRAARAYEMHSIFGDAESRAKNVVADSAAGMNRKLRNTSVETPRGNGLTGIFTGDAIDRARYTNELHEQGKADLGIIIIAWSALEHATYVHATLASASPVVPPEPTTQTPGPALAALLAVLALAALTTRRPR